jgi:hypothetical protein
MELIKGVAITRFCDEQKLTLEQRLELCIPCVRRSSTLIRGSSTAT